MIFSTERCTKSSYNIALYSPIKMKYSTCISFDSEYLTLLGLFDYDMKFYIKRGVKMIACLKLIIMFLKKMQKNK